MSFSKLLLALFVLPQPWGLAAIVAGATIDLAETAFFLRWSQRRRAHVGVEALVGRHALVVSALAPRGQVKIDGELWAAESDTSVESGSEVLVREVQGLTLLVRPVTGSASAAPASGGS